MSYIVELAAESEPLSMAQCDEEASDFTDGSDNDGDGNYDATLLAGAVLLPTLELTEDINSVSMIRSADVVIIAKKESYDTYQWWSMQLWMMSRQLLLLLSTCATINNRYGRLIL
jgi:hypothetical protein